jgi:hypothetical protein
LVKRANSTREAVPFQITPMLLTALVAAGVSTVLLAVLWYVDAYPASPPPLPAPRPPSGGGPPRPPGIRASLAVAVGLFSVAWVSVILVACRDRILRRIDQAADRIAAATLEFAEQREQEGIFRGMQLGTQSEPDPASGSGGGAHVVPFPRHAPSPDTSDD